jgi:hypothetical protein
MDQPQPGPEQPAQPTPNDPFLYRMRRYAAHHPAAIAIVLVAFLIAYGAILRVAWIEGAEGNADLASGQYTPAPNTEGRSSNAADLRGAPASQQHGADGSGTTGIGQSSQQNGNASSAVDNGSHGSGPNAGASAQNGTSQSGMAQTGTMQGGQKAEAGADMTQSNSGQGNARTQSNANAAQNASGAAGSGTNVNGSPQTIEANPNTGGAGTNAGAAGGGSH